MREAQGIPEMLPSKGETCVLLILILISFLHFIIKTTYKLFNKLLKDYALIIIIN